MHARQQIREAFVLALADIPGVTTYNGRVFPVYNETLPAIAVYSREESIETENTSGRVYGQQKRTLVVSVQIYAKVQGVIDDALDGISEQVETEVFTDSGIASLLRCLDLATTEIEVDSGAENAVGVMTLNFECKYLTEDGSPGVIV